MGRPAAMASDASPLACVMGDMDLVRPLGKAGIQCAVVAPPGAPTRFSRFTREVVPAPAAVLLKPESADHGPLVEVLVQFGEHQSSKPVLYFEDDWHLLFVSRNRERLARSFRFKIGEPTLIEDLTDKARFQALAERLGLPVPPARRLHPAGGARPGDVDLEFPLVVKPLPRRSPAWQGITQRKAIATETPAALCELWPKLVQAEIEVLLQALVPGPESTIESYHAYVDDTGEIAGEFTGRKVRTYPLEHGHSTALMITTSSEVASTGRELLRRIGLTGVSKLDFKRDPAGELRLLEVNPRFNLWHNPGAVAGINLPALVYADLTGRSRAPAGVARGGVTWCLPWEDMYAIRASGTPLMRWLRWVAASETKSALALDDPMPFLRGELWPRLARRAS